MSNTNAAEIAAIDEKIRKVQYMAQGSTKLDSLNGVAQIALEALMELKTAALSNGLKWRVIDAENLPEEKVLLNDNGVLYLVTLEKNRSGEIVTWGGTHAVLDGHETYIPVSDLLTKIEID